MVSRGREARRTGAGCWPMTAPYSLSSRMRFSFLSSPPSALFRFPFPLAECNRFSCVTGVACLCSRALLRCFRCTRHPFSVRYHSPVVRFTLRACVVDAALPSRTRFYALFSFSARFFFVLCFVGSVSVRPRTRARPLPLSWFAFAWAGVRVSLSDLRMWAGLVVWLRASSSISPLGPWLAYKAATAHVIGLLFALAAPNERRDTSMR